MSPGWAFTILAAAVCAQTVFTEDVYGAKGGEVTLRPDPGSFTSPISSIAWKIDGNYAMELNNNLVESYRQFQVRGELNKSTGEMTIRQLTQEDSGFYTPEINNKILSSIRLTVISAVPEPTISKSCNSETQTCELICVGDRTGAGPVSYSWWSDEQEIPGSSNKNYTFKEDSSGVKMFRCQMWNPVSKKFSPPFNPSSPPPEEEDGKQLNIAPAVTVAIVLLVTVVLAVVFHKWRTGMWFYEKDSMPWEGDFWRRDVKPQTNTVESNGSLAEQQNEEPSGDTPLKVEEC